jgi:acetolactate synthase-1/2/3 large subunit
MRVVVPSESAAPKRAADQIVSWLAIRGIRRVFGIPGGAISPLFDALVDSDLEVIICQHEAMAVYFAAGYARATGLPGVVAVTSGPGVLNTVSAVAAAYQDEVPLLILAGEVRTDWDGRGAIQDGGPSALDVMTVFRSVVRFQDTLDQPERLPTLLASAEAAMMAHPRGPALLRLPVNVASTPAPSVSEGRSTVPVDHPSGQEVEQMAATLSQAQRPVLMVGNGARTAGVGELVEQLAYRLRAPVISDLEGKGVVSEADPLCLGLVGVGQGPQVSRFLSEPPDVLLTIGSRMDDTSTVGFSETLRPTRAFLQIDHDPHRIHRPWRAEQAVVADLRSTLSLLVEALPRLSPATLLAREKVLRGCRAPEEVVGELGEAPHHPAAVVRALQEVFPEAIFTADIGSHMLFAARHLVATMPSSYQMSNGLGSMGSGIGLAMGLASALGSSRQVVSICGDGGLLMVGNELATCARYQIPVVVAVFDNRSLGMVEDGMVRLFGRSAHGGVPEVSLVAYGASLGATARTIRSRQDLADIAGLRINGPLLLHFEIDPSVRAGNPRVAGFVPAERSHHG